MENETNQLEHLRTISGTEIALRVIKTEAVVDALLRRQSEIIAFLEKKEYRDVHDKVLKEIKETIENDAALSQEEEQ